MKRNDACFSRNPALFPRAKLPPPPLCSQEFNAPVRLKFIAIERTPLEPRLFTFPRQISRWIIKPKSKAISRRQPHQPRVNYKVNRRRSRIVLNYSAAGGNQERCGSSSGWSNRPVDPSIHRGTVSGRGIHHDAVMATKRERAATSQQCLRQRRETRVRLQENTTRLLLSRRPYYFKKGNYSRKAGNFPDNFS